MFEFEEIAAKGFRDPWFVISNVELSDCEPRYLN